MQDGAHVAPFFFDAGKRDAARIHYSVGMQ
jgi:hypothetical protein